MKIIQIMLLLLFLAAQSFANPASSVTFPVKQPDGTVLEVRQEGNEWFHVLKTSDGYILQKDERGFYAYANENGTSSGIYAKNAGERSGVDAQFLSNLNQKTIYDKLLKDASLERPAKNDAPRLMNSVVQRLPSYNRFKTKGDIHVPVILVQYQDVKFKSADPVAQYTD